MAYWDAFYFVGSFGKRKNRVFRGVEKEFF